MADINSKISQYLGRGNIGDEREERRTTDYQTEVQEWADVNKKLKHHGLPVVKFLHPSDVSLLTDRNLSMDLPMSKNVRENFVSLLADCDHRQTLIQDLIVTNNSLKDDMVKQSSMTDKYHGRMKELKVLLESSRSRVQELEEERDLRTSYFAEEEDKILTTKKAIHAKYKHLEQKCLLQEEEIDRLKHKIQKMADEEDKRTTRQNQVFQEFKKRTSRAHNVMDEKLLDIIDAYEKQIYSLQRELEFYKTGENDDVTDVLSTSSTTPEVSQNIKALIKSYEKQLRESEKRIKKLEDEKELVKLDMGSRPEVGDYRVATQRIKKLEKLLMLHNISVPGEKQKNDPYRLKKKYSTKLEDLDYLPLDFCRQYLRDISMEVEAEDLEKVVPCIQKLRDQADISERYEKFCRRAHNLVEDEKTSGSKQRSRSLSPSRKKEPLTEKQLHNIMTVLDGWSQDEDNLQELQLSLNKLSDRVAPWLKIRMTGDASVSQIIAAVDKLVFDDGIARDKDGREHPSRTVLENIVQHFQTLFDVPSVSGVFPRMNEIYSKLGEVHNVLTTLKNLLGLEPDAKSGCIVDTVGRLCQTHNQTTSRQLKQLLQTEDLDGVIKRLEEHAEFFPTFREIMRKLYEILDVQRMDQVIPAVRALKLLAS